MNKTEAMERLNRLKTVVESADNIRNVSWSDIALLEQFAKEIGVWNDPEVYKSFETLRLNLAYDSSGRRKGITWTQVYDLFKAMTKAIEGMDTVPEQQERVAQEMQRRREHPYEHMSDTQMIRKIFDDMQDLKERVANIERQLSGEPTRLR